jgi:hypothetical protein
LDKRFIMKKTKGKINGNATTIEAMAKSTWSNLR